MYLTNNNYVPLRIAREIINFKVSSKFEALSDWSVVIILTLISIFMEMEYILLK